jgi:hypothetical protein
MGVVGGCAAKASGRATAQISHRALSGGVLGKLEGEHRCPQIQGRAAKQHNQPTPDPMLFLVAGLPARATSSFMVVSRDGSALLLQLLVSYHCMCCGTGCLPSRCPTSVTTRRPLVLQLRSSGTNASGMCVYADAGQAIGGVSHPNTRRRQSASQYTCGSPRCASKPLLHQPTRNFLDTTSRRCVGGIASRTKKCPEPMRAQCTGRGRVLPRGLSGRFNGKHLSFAINSMLL